MGDWDNGFKGQKLSKSKLAKCLGKVHVPTCLVTNFSVFAFFFFEN